jgi:hypothetical protein
MFYSEFILCQVGLLMLGGQLLLRGLYIVGITFSLFLQIFA